MKKWISKLSILVTAICLMAFAVYAQKADTCQACGEAVNWETMPSSVPTAAGHYHYRLREDATCNQWELPNGVSICIDLCGNTIRSGGKGRVFSLKNGAVLNILDSVGGGEIVGKTGTNNVTGGVMIMAAGSACNMYGGTMRLETKYVAGKGVGSGGIVYMNEAGTFNLYGGIIQGAQLVKSEYSLSVNGYGAAFFMSSNSALNIYGGQILSGTVPEGCKGVCVYMNSAKPQIKLSGNGSVEEFYFPYESDQVTIEGTYIGTAVLRYKDAVAQGTVLGSCENASIARASITCGDWMVTEEKGKLIAIPDSVAAVPGETTAYYETVQAALENGSSIKLLKNDQTFTVRKDISLDLNGQNAAVTVESGTLTAFDSQTDDYTVEDGIYGQLTLTGEAAAMDGYLQVCQDGKLSFHKVGLEIYAMTLRPERAGVYYKSRILGDVHVMDNMEKYGVALNAFEAPSEANMQTTSKYSVYTHGSEATGTLLYGIVKTGNPEMLNETNANMPIYGSAYLLTKDGTYVFGSVVERTLRQQVEDVDTIFPTLEEFQKAAAVAMYDQYESVMRNWEVPNIRTRWTENVMKIETQKACSHTPGNTVAPGEEITYYLTVTNKSTKTQRFTVQEPVPENTTCESGNLVCWDVTLAAGESRQLSYTVRVKEDIALCDGGSVVWGGVELFIEHTLNKVDGGYFVDAVKALSDSSYSGMDLANRLFVHAFTQSVLENNNVTETALDDIIAGENAVLLDMVAPTLYGGKTMPAQLTGVKGESAGAVTEKDLINGDILLADSKVYAYAEGLWLLEKGAAKQDTAAILAALPEADKYAVLRPTCALAGIITPTDEKAPLDVLNDYQKALIATAEAYLLRGEKLQYSDTRFTAQGSAIGTEYRWQSKVNAPEDCTSVEWGYTNCAAFTYETYYQALGFALPDNMYTTNALVNKGATNGTRIYHYHRELDSVQTDGEKAQVEKEFTELLEPGDILVILRKGGYGHAMLYVGNGNIIHSGGSVYQYTASVGTEVYEASIRRMKVKDYFFNPASAKGYVFDLVQDLAIVRPLKIFTDPIPQNTLNRLANLQGIMAQKTSSHAKSQTVNPGEEMTFTYQLYNTNDTAVTLDVVENLPENTTYISGAETVSGSTLSWKVTVPANARVAVSYKLKVNDDVAYGTTIRSTDSTVGGVTVKCPGVQVRRTLTAAEQAKLIQAVKDTRTNGNTLTGLELVNKLYETATGKANIFVSTDIVAVTEGADGIFAKKQMSTESNPRQIYQMNTGSVYNNLVAPTLYGGYRMWTPLWQHDRIRLPQEHDLQVGDVHIGRTLSSRNIYLYAGPELGFVNMNKTTLDADTVSVALRLERLHGYGYYFAILRPSMGL